MERGLRLKKSKPKSKRDKLRDGILRKKKELAALVKQWHEMEVSDV